MKRILQSAEGEVPKLGSPWAGDITIKVDAHRAGTSISVWMTTVPPGAQLPSHRHVREDAVAFRNGA